MKDGKKQEKQEKLCCIRYKNKTAAAIRFDILTKNTAIHLSSSANGTNVFPPFFIALIRYFLVTCMSSTELDGSL